MPFVASTRTMSANVDEIGGTLPRRRRVVMIRQAKRDVSLRQQPKDVRPIPARMPKFKTVMAPFREQLEKGCKSFGISLEIRRELEQHGTRLVAQQFQSLLDQGEAVD